MQREWPFGVVLVVVAPTNSRAMAASPRLRECLPLDLLGDLLLVFGVQHWSFQGDYDYEWTLATQWPSKMGAFGGGGAAVVVVVLLPREQPFLGRTTKHPVT